MKKKTFVIFMLIMMLVASSCSNETSSPNIIDEIQEEEVVDVVETLPEIPEEAEDTEEVDDPNKVVSPLDGLKYFPEELDNRPVAVSIDNHPDARWQSGLSNAEIIYEFEVEFPYTRYLCIFLAGEPELVGPVRSARPYIIYYALENDGIFVHVGGSQDAFAEVDRLNCAEVDGLYSGAMWRYYDTGKVAPHNMYTTLKSVRDESASYGYRTEGTFEGYSFNEKSMNLSDQYESFAVAEKINIIYNKNNTTNYEYDSNMQVYLRFKDGEVHIDELDNKQLSSKNIIVIEASKSVLDSAGRLELGTIGEGRGFYMTQGQSTSITWKKENEKARTRFYAGGEEISLNPGNTWIQVVSNINNVSVSAN